MNFVKKNLSEKLIGLLIDDLPGFDSQSAHKLFNFLEEQNYNVKVFDIKSLYSSKGDIGCAVFIVPGAEFFPADCADYLKDYSERGGNLIILGGPMFNRLIKKIDDKYCECDYSEELLDVTFSEEMGNLVMEGFVPTYKTYLLHEQTTFETEPNQNFFHGNIACDKPEEIIVPFVRPSGQGYDQKRKTRYIPLVHCKGTEGRANGRLGAAAFFMLNKTFNYPFFHVGTRPGSVGSSIIGSATAGIGFTSQQLLNITGIKELLIDVIDQLLSGTFLFEGGCDAFFYRPGEKISLGAKILNTRQDYAPLTVKFTVSEKNRVILEHEVNKLAGPRNISDLHFFCSNENLPEGNYIVKVTLMSKEKVIDTIEHETTVAKPIQANPEDFIKVDGDNFTLRGKSWYPVGINYWPNFFAGVEEGENWYGWLTDSFYDQVEVEHDLSYIEKCGFNFIMTRIDGNIFEHSIPQLLDFLERCRNHGIYVSLSWPEAMSPLYYNKEAIGEFFKLTGIANNPTVICYDLIWEMGGQPLYQNFIAYWDDSWRQWIKERYGSIKNAENDWNYTAARNKCGQVVAPSQEQLKKDGEWRIMVAAYRRFMDDLISSKWNVASRNMRSHAPNQLLTYRLGVLSSLDVAYSSTGKHVDFVAPEGYGFKCGEDEYNATCFVSRLLDFYSGGKPIVWAEFGISSIGQRNRGLFWDRNKMSPLPEKIEMQTAYMKQFFKMIIDSGCNGLAPWWWSSGVRKREMSDFGFLSPDGTLRPWGKLFTDMINDFYCERNRPKPDAWFDYDRDTNASGHFYVCRGPGREAWGKAIHKGKFLGIRTAGTGTDSSNVPLIAIGNTPYNGKNPLKFLNSEFNEAVLMNNKGNCWNVMSKKTINVPQGTELKLKVSVGNTQEAKWLQPSTQIDKGGVYLTSTDDSDIKVNSPVPWDINRYEDIDFLNISIGKITNAVTIVITMKADGIGTFGEKLSIKINTFC